MVSKNKSINRSALIAGISILISVMAAPFAEIYAYPQLIVRGDAAATFANITEHKTLFVACMFGYLITFLCDLVITWSLYIQLKPVSKNLSLLTALFRLTYTILALVALNNLVTVYSIISNPEYTTVFKPDQLIGQSMFFLKSFKSQWYFGLLFFAIHLLFLGYLCFRSRYIPRLLGVILIITGVGYLLTTLRTYLFPSVNIDFARYTFYGELIFMIWLLVKGIKGNIGLPENADKVISK